ncbi:hypothetical protein SEMRO_168_G074820.1 [Seminavis robusta]|uniref:Uncharacterized protein n=1 Tax=Seminavis robusta TaxID=568900 RepID=A0A9N8DMX8_9STRA|nr:hypothetical protein SEMRO_168_G074820.1 [Seminavis robusta]|eukprot:Sro168_g074820.1 n/a (321) ;mRNA; r:48022-49143
MAQHYEYYNDETVATEASDDSWSEVEIRVQQSSPKQAVSFHEYNGAVTAAGENRIVDDLYSYAAADDDDYCSLFRQVFEDSDTSDLESEYDDYENSHESRKIFAAAQEMFDHDEQDECQVLNLPAGLYELEDKNHITVPKQMLREDGNDECHVFSLSDDFLAHLRDLAQNQSDDSDNESESSSAEVADEAEISDVNYSSLYDKELQRWCFDPIESRVLSMIEVSGSRQPKVWNTSGGLWVVHSMPEADLASWTGSEEFYFALDLEMEKEMEQHESIYEGVWHPIVEYMARSRLERAVDLRHCRSVDIHDGILESAYTPYL